MRHTNEAIQSVMTQLAANTPLDRLHRTIAIASLRELLERRVVDERIAARADVPGEVKAWLDDVEQGVD